MSGRHRQTPTNPARRALLGAVPLVGSAGVVGGVLVGATPEPAEPVAVADMADTAPAPAPAATVPTASTTVPGRGETAMDAVAGARDAALARDTAADDRTSAEVSTVARELRVQAEQRAEQARTDGDAELAAYHREEAAAQQRVEESSRPVVPADRDPVPDPGDECSSSDLLQLGPLSMAGPDDPECGVDPWVAGQLEDQRADQLADRLADRLG